MHQWIRLNKVYKLMESFFQIRFRINGQKPKIFNEKQGWVYAS